MPTNTDFKIYCGKEMVAQASSALIAGKIIDALWCHTREGVLRVKYGGRVVFNSNKANGDPRSNDHIIKANIAKNIRDYQIAHAPTQSLAN